MRPRETWEWSRGPLPYQIKEKPYTNVRNLTDTTVQSAESRVVFKSLLGHFALELGCQLQHIGLRQFIQRLDKVVRRLAQTSDVVRSRSNQRLDFRERRLPLIIR